MAETDLTLDQFLARLAATRGLGAKVRLLARYWQQVQSLPPSQRERVAMAMGTDFAWRRLEKLFARDGSLSEEEQLVGRSLERLGRADPAELRSLAEEVRRGDRASLRSRLLEVIGGALEEEAQELQVEGAEEPAVEERTGTTSEAIPPAEAGASEDIPPPPPAPAPDPAVERGSQVVPPESRPAEPEPDPEPEAPAAEQAPPTVAAVDDAVPFEPTAAAVAVESEEEAAAPTVDREADRPAVEPPAEVEAPPPTLQPGGGRERSLSATERLQRLRMLDRDSTRVAALGPDDRRRLLEEMGSGWAARRALSAMIRNRALKDLDEALALARELDTPVQQTWCLADLLEHWALDEAEVGRVIDAAPGPAGRRRLERRSRTASGA